MFSLYSLFLFFAFIGTFVSSTPLPTVDGAVVARDSSEKFVGRVVDARGGPRPLVVILASVNVDIGAQIDPLNHITAETATADTIKPIIDSVQGIIAAAVVEIGGLVGISLDIVLSAADGNGRVSVDELAQVVFGILSLVLTPLGVCAKVAVGKGDVIALLVVVGNVLGNLVNAILLLVPDLLVSLKVLIGGLGSIIVELNLTVLISLGLVL